MIGSSKNSVSDCEFADQVGMNQVGRCPENRCFYRGVVLLTPPHNTYQGTFSCEGKAVEYAKKWLYSSYIIQRVEFL